MEDRRGNWLRFDANALTHLPATTGMQGTLKTVVVPLKAVFYDI